MREALEARMERKTEEEERIHDGAPPPAHLTQHTAQNTSRFLIPPLSCLSLTLTFQQNPPRRSNSAVNNVLHMHSHMHAPSPLQPHTHTHRCTHMQS